MNRTYKQQYTEQQNLEVKVANNFGYSALSNNLDIKSKKQVVSQPPKVANITLRQFTKDLPKTDRIKQVQDQIKALHNQRKLMEENQRAAEAQLNGLAPQINQNKIMEWVQQRIRQYNDIIQHRHLMKNNIDEIKVLNESQNQLEKHFSQKQPSDGIESRIVQWAQRKFGEYMNSKATTPTNKKQPPQVKKTHEKLTQPEEILKKIQEKKKQLQFAPYADLTYQISINRQIASLYRLFYRQNQLSTTDQFRKTKSIAAEPPRSLDKHLSNTHFQELSNPTYRQRFLSTNMNNYASGNNLIGEVTTNQRKNNNREVSYEYKTSQVVNKYKQLEYNKYYTASGKLSKDGKDVCKQELLRGKNNQKLSNAKSSIRKDLNEAYLQKKEVQEYKSMQNKIRSNSQAFELWKSKIQDACNKSTVVKKKEQSSKFKQIEDIKNKNQLYQREQELGAIIGNNLKEIGLDQGAHANAYIKEIALKNKQHEQQKEDIFSQLLRKRNNKYNKLWGTKILVKYDSRRQAKHMLKGDAGKKAKSKLDDERGWKTSRSIHSPSGTRAADRNESEEASLIKDQNDEQHYWRMCKNQKINLLLKRR